ncbi:uncharacterized protein LOC124275387 [Haliotis rubra]|uniref:uncharacterized protein LOC124275387 n=1 Tax=Haliotis rubra TaxID=36100 RepID=UPI001EE51536|nr:uncharacterized protein LOC124275387 [Haliotis rubra]
MVKMLPIILKFVLIQLCLGVIHSELVNIALNKATTTMSSGIETNTGQGAVDGSANDVNCTALVTTSNEVAWLRIDLETTVKVHIIVIHPGSQSSSNLTWHRPQVYVSNRPEITSRPDDEDLCNLLSSTLASSLNATCGNRGRFVFVRNIHSFYLCEVLVYVCSNGSYGPDCSQRCGYCGGGSCDAETGVCGSGGCLEGYSGTNCNIHSPNSGMSAPVAAVIGAVIMLFLIIAVVAAICCFFYCRVRRNTSGAGPISRRHSEDRVNNNSRQGILSRSYVRFTSLFRTPREPVVDVHQTRRKSIDRRSTQDPPRNDVYVRKKSVTDESGVAVKESNANNGVTADDPVVQPGVDNCAFEDEDPHMYEEPLSDPSVESEYLAMGGENHADQNYENQGAEPDDEDQPVYEAMEIPGNKGSKLSFNMQSVPDHPNMDGEC